MNFQQFPPSPLLQPYIKCYWIFATGQEGITETIYPSGYLELAINISAGNVVTILNDRHIKMPPVEVLGHLTAPGKITASKSTTLLIARFHPHASAIFFPAQASEFTNDSIDLKDLIKQDAEELFERIMEQETLEQKVAVLDRFLVNKLKGLIKDQQRLELVRHLSAGDTVSVEKLAQRFGVSERYVQKLFLDYVGVTPKSFFNIQRFNKSLQLVRTSTVSLTSIAYECGYFDQAHFIKEFRNFTGLTPSQYQQSLVVKP
ncbi:helix-turn-helix transcriptional regulator [Chitinophaga barathri]|uniref:Helix-turn-helix domain-containing protein n=1 Tax=Chitinophaga barathri TaxID=1647451 RepID=A0A3N4M7F5_9BACT|nr:helix-turn-helix transcriptional regulator [Chitinophaga barathri]RPD39135.1 helix-turn-helix domain-containing protein [Chitinophaga barathri]